MTRPRLNDDQDDDKFDIRLRRIQQREDAPGGMSGVKIAAIVGGVALCVALICGGVATFAIYAFKQTADGVVGQIEKMQKDQEKLQKELENSDKEKSRQFANSFVQELREKHAEAAYAMTTAAYQKRVSLEQLQELMTKQQAVLRRFTGFFADVLAPDMGEKYTFHESIPDGGKARRLSVTAVKEKEAWKVNEFTVEDDDQLPKEP